MKKHHIVIIAVFLLCLLFTYAGLVKALDYNLFVTDMAKSPLLVKYDKVWLAPVILGTEFLIVILLGFQRTRKTGLYLSFFVMSVFTLYLGVLYFFFTNIPCSCGGILGKMSYPTHITFNTIFTLIAGTGVMLSE
jgi:hypothetical protein